MILATLNAHSTVTHGSTSSAYEKYSTQYLTTLSHFSYFWQYSRCAIFTFRWVEKSTSSSRGTASRTQPFLSK